MSFTKISIERLKGRDWVEGRVTEVGKDGICKIETGRGSVEIPASRILVQTEYATSHIGSQVWVTDYENAYTLFPVYKGLEVYVDKEGIGGESVSAIAYMVVSEIFPGKSMNLSKRDFQEEWIEEFARNKRHLYTAWLKVVDTWRKTYQKLIWYREKWADTLQEAIINHNCIEIVEKNKSYVTLKWGGRRGVYILVDFLAILEGGYLREIGNVKIPMFVAGDDVITLYNKSVYQCGFWREPDSEGVVNYQIPKLQNRLDLLLPSRYVNEKWNNLLNKRFNFQSNYLKSIAGLKLLEIFQTLYSPPRIEF